MSKIISQKDYKKKILKLEKIEKSVREARKQITGVQTNFTDSTKLKAIDSLIGYLVRNGKDSGLPMDVIIDIGNDYEKKLEKI